MIRFFLSLVVLFTLFGCQQSSLTGGSPSAENPAGRVSFTMGAPGSSVNSRIYLEEDENNVWNAYWEADDKLGVWSSDVPQPTFAEFIVDTLFNDKGVSATFGGVPAGAKLRALYPFPQGEHTITDGLFDISVGSQNTSIPASRKGVVDKHSMYMIGAAEFEASADAPVSAPLMQHIGAVLDLRISFSEIAPDTKYYLHELRVGSVEDAAGLVQLPISATVDLSKSVIDADFLSNRKLGAITSQLTAHFPLIDAEVYSVPLSILPFDMPSSESLRIELVVSQGVVYRTYRIDIQPSRDIALGRATRNTLSFRCNLLSSDVVHTEARIGSAADLAAFGSLVSLESAEYVGLDARVVANIDMTSITHTSIAGPSAQPSYVGQFDGCGYSISNLAIANSTTDNIGLFARLGSGAVVRNLTLNAPSIEPNRSYVGAIAGWAVSATISGCVVNAGLVSGNGFVGGVLGFGEGVLIENCLNYSHVEAVSGNDNMPVGGIVGRTNGQSIIFNCHNHGNIVSSQSQAGGIVGSLPSGTITMSASSSTGSVSAPSAAGGLLGAIFDRASLSLYGSYNSGTITGESEIGGIAGSVARIFNTYGCYTTGIVKQRSGFEQLPTSSGLYLGVESAPFHNPLGCYYLVQTEGVTTPFVDDSSSADLVECADFAQLNSQEVLGVMNKALEGSGLGYRYVASDSPSTRGPVIIFE